jgi:hypothetical protein
MTFRLWSDCLEGIVHVNASGTLVTTPTLSIGIEAHDYQVRALSSTKSVDATIHFNAESSHSVRVSFTLADPLPFDPNPPAPAPGIPDSGSGGSFWDAIRDFFKQLFSGPLSGFITMVVLVVIVYCAFWIAVYLARCLRGLAVKRRLEERKDQ